jgi:hypothetical protein
MHSCFYLAHGPRTSVISWQFNVNSPNLDMDDEIADENVNDEAGGVVQCSWGALSPRPKWTEKVEWGVDNVLCLTGAAAVGAEMWK